MSKNIRLFTSESVTEGHPDKMCDQISDAILDEILKRDPDARVACETMITTGLVLVSGEISTDCYVDIPKVVRKTIKNIGYTRAKYGFDCDTCAVLTAIDEQSSDIARGVDDAMETRMAAIEDKECGAGDQGMMFGYACRETEEYMPLSLVLAHRLCKNLADLRKNDILPLLRPDGKAQVTVEYQNDEIKRVHTVVVSTQHDETYDFEILQKDIKEKLIKKVIPTNLLDDDTKILINPTGRFVIGGPQGDTGLTGRKIIVDTYGGVAAHGGGAFSGKDPTKVDRSAAYMARYIAKNIVAASLADKIQVQLAYAIGVSKPVSVNVNTYGTNKIPEVIIEELIEKTFALSPQGIIKHFNLRRPIYQQTASYGHFGRTDLELPWEKLDKVQELKYNLSLL